MTFGTSAIGFDIYKYEVSDEWFMVWSVIVNGNFRFSLAICRLGGLPVLLLAMLSSMLRRGSRALPATASRVGGQTRSTTILSVRKGDQVFLIGDGQVSIGSQMVKSNARKVRTSPPPPPPPPPPI